MNILCFFCLVTLVPVVIWQISFVGAVWLFCIGVWIKQRSRRLILLAVGSALAFIAAVLLSCYAYVAVCCWAQVLRSQSLYAGPSSVYHQIGCLDAGEVVRVCKTHGTWICVETQKIKGWLPL